MSKTTLAEYQDRAIASAVYPSQHRVTYPALALAGEVGEVAEKILNQADPEAIGKEIGGVLWYCAALAQDLGTDLSKVVSHDGPISELHITIRSVKRDFVSPVEPQQDQEGYTLGMTVFAGQIANQVKKVLRGDFLLHENRDKIIDHLSSVVFACCFVADGVGLDLGDIADQNIAVLTSRKERGTLLGNGDNR